MLLLILIFVYTYTVDGLHTMADHRLEVAEVIFDPLLPLRQFRRAVTAPLLVETGVGVPQGLEPSLKMINSLPHFFPLVLPELSLLVHSPVVSLLDVPDDVVFTKEIAHELFLLDIKTKLCLLGPLLPDKFWQRGGGGHGRSYRCY